jgi:hypothetical protein
MTYGIAKKQVLEQRATVPDNLHTQKNNYYHRANCIAISRNFKKIEKPTIWAAWGTVIQKRKYLRDCLFDIVREVESFDPRWITIGKRSKAGHPHHPLYLSLNSQVKEFDIQKYLEN